MARFAVFNVTLSKVYTAPVTVNYETVDGTAIADQGDYIAKSGTLTFAPGDLTKEILVQIRSSDAGLEEVDFSVNLSAPTGGTIGSSSTGDVTIPGESDEGEEVVLIPYLERFGMVYAALHEPDNQYFGPNSGSGPQRVVPKHIAGVDPQIINEAPDYGGETVSETASFWLGLEVWNAYYTKQMNGTASWAGYVNAWNMIETYYIPAKAAANMAVMNPDSPADYIPAGNTPTLYPRASDVDAPVGVDPLWDELETTYSNAHRMYLMHWILDVEGKYGFHNKGGGTRIVYINTYQRGLQESSYETVPQGSWNDWNNGGGPYGYEPLFTQGTQVYPSAPFDYGQKWSYTNAPDAEVRALQWSFFAADLAADIGGGSSITATQVKAKKMGDYLRYALFDKYFRKIGDNQHGTDFTGDNAYKSAHYLISWYVAWGGEIVPSTDPTPDRDPYYNFLVGSSECHQGYQGVNMAYQMATGGGGNAPLSASAGGVWLASLYRQIEMIRWLQSPEGPIAGGVTNSMYDQYLAVTDGRQTARFYGMDYVYSPVWHDPVSNNWVGFQAWGQGRTADLFLEVSDKSTTLALAIRPNLEIILDKLVNWVLSEVNMEHILVSFPTDLSWTSDTEVAGQTIHVANLEGKFEYKPTLNWPDDVDDPDYASFWSTASVPNPNLHCTITNRGQDLGVIASMAYLLIAYAKAKRNMSKFTTAIPNSSGKTPKDAYVLARRLLDRCWKHWDGIGVVLNEDRVDYNRMGDTVYVPTNFHGEMPNGDPVEHGATFISIRTFLKDYPEWDVCEAYIAGTGPAPSFKYHRFWAQAEYAISVAAMDRYFGDYIATDDEYDYEV